MSDRAQVKSDLTMGKFLPVSSSSFLSIWQGPGHGWLVGLRVIWSQPPLVVLFVMYAAMYAGEGVFGVMLIIFVRQVLNSDAVIYGSLLSIQTIGRKSLA